MQVLSCAPAHVRDSFSHYEGESPRGLDTERYTRRPTKKTHGDRVSSRRPVDFGSSPGKSRYRTSEIGDRHLSGFRVYQDLGAFVPCIVGFPWGWTFDAMNGDPDSRSNDAAITFKKKSRTDS
jgi:hypothetical protein